MELYSNLSSTKIFDEVINPQLDSSDDLNFNDVSDWHSLPFVKAKALVLPYLSFNSITKLEVPENELYTIFYNGFASYAGIPITNYMLTNMKYPTRILHTMNTTDLSKAVVSSTQFSTASYKYRDALEEVIRDNYYFYNPTGVENKNTPIDIPAEDFQNKIQNKWIRFNWSVFNTDFLAKYNNYDTACTAAIGGYKALQIYASDFTVWDEYPLNRIGYKVTLRFVIRDNFGVGADDIYSPSLAAMYLLQHGFANYTPFKHFINVDLQLEGKINIEVRNRPSGVIDIEL